MVRVRLPEHDGEVGEMITQADRPTLSLLAPLTALSAPGQTSSLPPNTVGVPSLKKIFLIGILL